MKMIRKGDLEKMFLEVIPDLDGIMEQLLDQIANNLDPEDVFDEKDLADWASRNGFWHEREIPE